MGKNFATAFTNIYMPQWERMVFPKCQKKAFVNLRYLDIFFSIWPYSKQDF